jgi:branched-chain amino acid transport system ATP-binding protein
MSFGGVQAVRGVSLRVAEGERRVIIGPNGAGKTTLFNLMAGQLRPTGGQVLMFGTDVTRQRPYQRARAGLARTFQISRLLKTMTVGENALIAAHGRRGFSLRAFCRLDADPDLVRRVEALLEEWGLAAEQHEPVQNISHGNQRLLEIVLALATQPRLVMLDEPTAGLSGGERDLVTSRLGRLPRDVTVILTDHDMDVVFEIADRIVVLDQGQVIADGLPAEIRGDPRVQQIYFGEE